MGGKEASRGFLCQELAAVLEALTDVSDWDKICVEFPTLNDKVDIALEKQGKAIKGIQVKSSINLFSKSDISEWLIALINDIECPEYFLYLIGQCDQSAKVFTKSIEKYCNNELDKEANRSLQGFETKYIDGKRIKFVWMPFEIEHFMSIVIDKLSKYISQKNHNLQYEKICFIASAMISDQIISSIGREGISRKEFDKKIEERIAYFSEEYSKRRVPIGIKSFTRGTQNMVEETEYYLPLNNLFDGRIIKDGYDWNKDIYKRVENFLISNTEKSKAYQLCLDAHASIAFAAGRILDTKEGIDIFPIQKTADKGTVLWDLKSLAKTESINWHFSNEIYKNNQYDTALILNISHQIYEDVIEFIKENKLPIGCIINCNLDKGSAINLSIGDGDQAKVLANFVNEAIKKRKVLERQATLHIFAAAPNGFMFFLGQYSRGFGKFILYEYDLEQQSSCSYSPSIVSEKIED